MTADGLADRLRAWRADVRRVAVPRRGDGGAAARAVVVDMAAELIAVVQESRSRAASA